MFIKLKCGIQERNSKNVVSSLSATVASRGIEMKDMKGKRVTGEKRIVVPFCESQIFQKKT